LKVNATSKVVLHKINITDVTVEKEETVYMSNKTVPIQSREEISEFVDNVGSKLETDIEKFTSKGSNWLVTSIENITLRLVKYRLLRGGVAGFQLPPELAGKQCVLNIDAQGSDCFKYAVVASLHNGKI